MKIVPMHMHGKCKWQSNFLLIWLVAKRSVEVMSMNQNEEMLNNDWV